MSKLLGGGLHDYTVLLRCRYAASPHVVSSTNGCSRPIQGCFEHSHPPSFHEVESCSSIKSKVSRIGLRVWGTIRHKASPNARSIVGQVTTLSQEGSTSSTAGTWSVNWNPRCWYFSIAKVVLCVFPEGGRTRSPRPSSVSEGYAETTRSAVMAFITWVP